MSQPTKNHSQYLSRIKHLIDSYHFDEALQTVNPLEQQKDLPADIRVEYTLLKSIIVNRLGKWAEGLPLAEAALHESQRVGTELQWIDAVIELAYSVCFPEITERYDEILELIKQSEQQLLFLTRDQPDEIPSRKAALLLHKGYIIRKRGNWDEGFEYLQQSLKIAEQIGHKLLIADALYQLGLLISTRTDLEQGIEYYHRSLSIRQKIDHKFGIALSLTQLGIMHVLKGDHEQALTYLKQGLDLAKQIDNKILIADSLMGIGSCYQWLGKLDTAVEFCQDSLNLSEQFQYKNGMLYSLHFLGCIYRDKGEFEQALIFLKHGMALAEEMQYFFPLNLEVIGNVYRQIGDLEQAMRYLEQSFNGFEKIGNLHYMGRNLFQLILVAIDKTAIDKAKQYLQRLKQLNAQMDAKYISQQYRVAEALILKTSLRPRHRGKAEDLFNQVIAETVVEHDLKAVAILNLCDLLLSELRVSETSESDPEILNEIHTHTTHLQEIATQQNSHWLLAESYVLQAKLALVELNVQDARRYLEQAQHIAEEHGLNRLAVQISSEHDTLLNQLPQWEDLIERNASMSERAELARLSDLLVRMVHKRVENIPELADEEPELLLITGADSGLNVFSKQFQTDRPMEEHLIAGFLTAINAFVQDAFASSGFIERIKHEEHTLILQTVDPFLLCYVFKGPSYFALQKLSRFIETLQESPSIWEMLTQALQTRRFLGKEDTVEALVSNVFLAPPVSS